MRKNTTINGAAIERQCGYAKSLAQQVELHADTAFGLSDRERDYLRRTAAQLWEIVHGLTEAAAAGDVVRVLRWWHIAVIAAASHIGAPVLHGIGEGAGGAITANFIENDTITECATAMFDFGSSSRPVGLTVNLSDSGTAKDISYSQIAVNRSAAIDTPGFRHTIARAGTARGTGTAHDPTAMTLSIDLPPLSDTVTVVDGVPIRDSIEADLDGSD